MSEKMTLEMLRHSAAHLLAHALMELFPDTILTIGPATNEGFFYDILPTHNLKEEDLKIVEQRMHDIAQRGLAITHAQMPKADARILYAHNPYR